QRLHPVHARQLHVHQDQVGTMRSRQLDAQLGVARLQRAVADVPEHVAHELHVLLVVLDDQDQGLGHRASPARTPRRVRVTRATRSTSSDRPNTPFWARWLIWPARRSWSALVMSFDVSTTIGTTAVSG